MALVSIPRGACRIPVPAHDGTLCQGNRKGRKISPPDAGSLVGRVKWLHGSDSRTLPFLRRMQTPAILPTGKLLSEYHIAPCCGELNRGINDLNGVNKTFVSGVTLAHREAAIFYSQIYKKPVTISNEIEHIKNPKHQLLNNAMKISMLRVLRLSNHPEYRAVVAEKLIQLSRAQDPYFMLPVTFREIEHSDTLKLSLPIKVGDIVAVPTGGDRYITTTVISIDDTKEDSIQLAMSDMKKVNATRWFDPSFCRTPTQDALIGFGIDQCRSNYKDTIKKLLDLCKKEAMASHFDEVDREAFNAAFPIVWATTNNFKAMPIPSAIKGEIGMKDGMHLGEGGIDIVFTPKANVPSLQSTLRKVQGISVLSFESLRGAVDVGGGEAIAS